MYFKLDQKVIKYLGFFCKKICQQQLSKTVQSGHTGSLKAHLRVHYNRTERFCYYKCGGLGQWL